ncbi:MAG: hypothetical protein E3J23_01640 [Candidatus Stahlbacteria bacterium]|nr:MAG: hypothetical protein E3J23_01640 [Candidatus Stahlbacteria bacterium]
MVVISNLDVEVGDTETQIIEPTQTFTGENRTFGVGNRDKEIIATAWGCEDGVNWVEEDSKTIAPEEYKVLVVGPTHYPWLKLTARTTTSTETSIVDGYLTYTPA